MTPLLALLTTLILFAPDPVIDAEFPGGNIVFEKIEGDTVFLQQDERDTPRFWFYWSFRVQGAAGRTLRFQFTKGAVLGERGPAVSVDGGNEWRWLESDSANRDWFAYQFGPDDADVRFCFAIPYLERNLQAFLEAHRGNPHFAAETLVKTAKGRGVELLRAGRLDGNAQRRVLLTARHHACESIADYVLEGAIEGFLADDDDGRWLRQNVELITVPFMDKDGVEAGDQGKMRKPHDHWLDYAGESRYESVRALRKRFEREPRQRVDVALDLHCPYLRDQRIYFATSPQPRVAAETARLSELLEQNQRGTLRHAAQDNMPFGKGWNTAETYARQRSFALWADELPGIRVSGTLEVPYATVGGTAVTAASARAFGQDLARALRLFLASAPQEPR